ncbi:WD40 repeat domain-containing protein [Streptomyces inhibens]|uniref:WD40 repeat domain-containing protein n=1 Tax=Streptomyces inhibens TaxID=2293571 RepID=UPI003790375D
MSTSSLLLASRIPSDSPILDFDIVVVGRHPFLVCTDFSGDVFSWDPLRDQWAGHRLDMPWRPEDEYEFSDILTIGAAVVDGRVVVGGGGDHQPFAQWDLASGAVRTYARYEHGGVASTTTMELDGRTLFLSGCTGPAVHLWDASKSDPDPAADEVELAGHGDGVGGVTAGRLWDRPVVVSGAYDGSVLVWDIAAEEPLTQFDDLDFVVRGVGLVTVDGHARVVVAGGRALVMGDPDTGAWEGPFAVPGDDIECMDVGVVDGLPVAVTGGEDGTVCVWDLAGRRLLGVPLTEHEKEVFAVRITHFDGRPVAVTAGRDRRMRLWDLRALLSA